MAHIVETILSDRRISLGNEEYFRQVNFGSNWNKVRVGVRFAINGRADIMAPAFLQIGFGSDANSYYTADRPTGYIGIRMCGGSSDNNPNIQFNYAQAQNSYFSFGTTELTTISKDATGTVTQSSRIATGGTYFGAASNTVLANEHELLVTIIKCGNGYALNDFCCPTSAAAVQAGKTFSQFQSDMDNETFQTPAISNLTRNNTTMPWVFGTGITFPPVSYLSVYWNHSTPTMEIANIQVSKFG